jgi:hypothetical protein
LGIDGSDPRSGSLVVILLELRDEEANPKKLAALAITRFREEKPTYSDHGEEAKVRHLTIAEGCRHRHLYCSENAIGCQCRRRDEAKYG